MKKLFFILPLLAFLFSCDNNDATPDAPFAKAKRTVLIYVCAENDLDEYFYNSNPYKLGDYQEMLAGAKNLKDDEYLIVFVDRLSTVYKPQIIRLSKNGAEVVKEYAEDFYCTDPDKMKEIMQWVTYKFPAESYGLTFWGHGSGWLFANDGSNTYASSRKKAYGYDSGTHQPSPQQRWINIPELAQTIKDGMPHLDFIFFDCCNMQCAEVAYELRESCDYIIASPSEIPGCGAPYDYVVSDFFLSKENLGKAIVDDYTSHGDFNGASGLPLSVVKTEAIENLALATQYALTKFMPQYPLNAAVDSCIYYWKSSKTSDYPCMFDIRSFMHKNLNEEDFKTWNMALQEAVVYKVRPERSTWKKDWDTNLNIIFSSFPLDDNYGGLSMFVPQTYYDKYFTSSSSSPNQLIKKMSWTSIVDWSNYGW